MVIWAKTRKLRSPLTGKRIYRRRPQSAWRQREIPEKRIVPADLWEATRRRMQIVEKLYDCGSGKRPRLGRAAGSPYLFTGLLQCADCRGSITIVSGQSKTRSDSRYGCAMHAYRGDRVCKNNLLIARSALEKQLLAGLQEKVLHPDVIINYTFARFEDELARSVNRQSSGTGVVRKQLQKIEAEIRNCTRAIASDGLSSFLRTRLASESAELETQHRDLTEKLAASEPRTIKLRFRDTRRFVETRLQDLQSMFDGEPRLVRAEIARHVQKITLKPVGKGYIASGVWDWLGGVAVRMVPGARIELATPAFSGRRSTNELPRHTTLVV
jgi:hypothetical protein